MRTGAVMPTSVGTEGKVTSSAITLMRGAPIYPTIHRLTERAGLGEVEYQAPSRKAGQTAHAVNLRPFASKYDYNKVISNSSVNLSATLALPALNQEWRKQSVGEPTC